MALVSTLSIGYANDGINPAQIYASGSHRLLGPSSKSLSSRSIQLLDSSLTSLFPCSNYHTVDPSRQCSVNWSCLAFFSHGPFPSHVSYHLRVGKRSNSKVNEKAKVKVYLSEKRYLNWQKVIHYISNFKLTKYSIHCTSQHTQHTYRCIHE